MGERCESCIGGALGVIKFFMEARKLAAEGKNEKSNALLKKGFRRYLEKELRPRLCISEKLMDSTRKDIQRIEGLKGKSKAYQIEDLVDTLWINLKVEVGKSCQGKRWD